MRWLMFFGLIFVPSHVLAYSSNLSELEVKLEYFDGPPALVAQIRIVQTRIRNYEQLFFRADSLGHAKNFQIVIIGQSHPVDRQTAADYEEVLASQLRIRCLLDSLNYPLICDEGRSADRITKAEKIRSLWTRRKRTLADSLSFAVQAQKLLAESGPLSYLWGHPSTILTGADDQALTRLHAVVYDRKDDSTTTNLIEFLNLRSLRHCLTRLRSEMALAKAIVALDKHGLTQGVIVIGDGHKWDFFHLFPLYGVAGRYYPSINIVEKRKQ